MTEIETCEIEFIDEAKVRAVQKKLAEVTCLHSLTETFKLLGDPTRLKILLALREEELCVCDLAALLGVTRSAISHQLRLLKSLRLVRYRKQGKVVYYTLDDQHISELISLAMQHMQEPVMSKVSS